VLGFVTGVGRIVQEIYRWNGYGRMFYEQTILEHTREGRLIKFIVEKELLL